MDVDGGLSLEQVKIVLHSTTPLALDSSRRWAVVAGMITEDARNSFKGGEEIVAYVQCRDDKKDLIAKDSITVDICRVVRRPSSLSHKDAVDLALSYLVAADLLQRELGVLPPSKVERTLYQSDSRKRFSRIDENGNIEVLVTGGETYLAVALTQLIRSHNLCYLDSPEQNLYRVFVTAAMTDQYDLFQRCIHIVMLGANCATDELQEDLVGSIGRDFGLIFDTNGAVSRQPEVLKRLVAGRHIDCRDRSVLSCEDDLPITRDVLESLLKDAAETMQSRTEMTCSNSEETDEENDNDDSETR